MIKVSVMDKNSKFSFEVQYLVFSNHIFQPFNFRILQDWICLQGCKDVYYLGKPSMEGFKFSKNIHLTKFKLFFVWILLKLLFGLVKAVLVFLKIKQQHRRKGKQQRYQLYSLKRKWWQNSGGTALLVSCLCMYSSISLEDPVIPSSNLEKSKLFLMQLSDVAFTLGPLTLVISSLCIYLPICLEA